MTVCKCGVGGLPEEAGYCSVCQPASKRGRPHGTTKPNPRSVQLAQRYTVEEREAIIKAAGGPRKACTYIRNSVITRLLSEKVIVTRPGGENVE